VDPLGSDLQLVEVHMTAVEGTVSPGVRRRLIEANLAVLEPLMEHLRSRLDACSPAGHGRVVDPRCSGPAGGRA
jgi:hypothetical protein